MPRKLPPLTELEVRKQLLVAESDINRARLIAELQPAVDQLHTLSSRVKSLGGILAAVTVFATGRAMFRRHAAKSEERRESRPSWFRTILSGAQMARSLWRSFRESQNNSD